MTDQEMEDIQDAHKAQSGRETIPATAGEVKELAHNLKKKGK